MRLNRAAHAVGSDRGREGSRDAEAILEQPSLRSDGNDEGNWQGEEIRSEEASIVGAEIMADLCSMLASQGNWQDRLRSKRSRRRCQRPSGRKERSREWRTSTERRRPSKQTEWLTLIRGPQSTAAALFPGSNSRLQQVQPDIHRQRLVCSLEGCGRLNGRLKGKLLAEQGVIGEGGRDVGRAGRD